MRRERIVKVAILVCILSLVQFFSLFQFKSRDPECERFSYTRLNVTKWLDTGSSFCNGNYTAYAHRFFFLKSVIFDPKADRFSISCRLGFFGKSPRKYEYYGKHGVYAPGRYTNSLEFTDISPEHRARASNKALTVAVYREYPHNFFHAMTQWFNIFTLSKLFNFDPKSVNILLLDRGPVVHIDEQWELLYNSVQKAAELPTKTHFDDVLFNIAGHESPLYYFELHQLPYVEEFSNYFMDMFKVSNKKQYSCSNLIITFYLRHDYLMHPENITSIRNTERKFQNENELLETLKEEFAGHTVQTLIAEDMPLETQLKLTTNSDVLIGMHGCVLSQALFLPSHAMVLEMYPITWTVQSFFRSIAKWRGIRHDIWQNKVKEMEFPDHKTYVPLSVFRDYAKSVREHFGCNRA